MFDLSTTTGIKDAGNYLRPGIHNATFQGIALDSIHSQNTGEDYKVMSLKLDIDGYGDYTNNFFEPKDDTRKPNNFGGINPSQVDHFMISLRQIFDALDAKIGEMIDNNNVTVNGKKVDITKLSSFDQLVKLANILTTPYIGTKVEIKLIPGRNGFAAMPAFPAKITRAGALARATVFIGHNLVLSDREMKQINAAQNATPTPAPGASTSTVDTLASELGLSASTEDDLPF